MSWNKFVTTGLVAALVSCGGGKHAEKAPARAETPVAVAGVAIRASDWPESFEATGTVRARTTATVAARMMGSVLQVSADTGDRVSAGQTLVTIDGRDLDAARRQAEAAVSEARSGIPEAESAIASAKAQLELTEVTAKRMSDLLSKRSVSQQEFDEASARVRVAKSAVEMAQARRRQLDSKIQQAEEAVQRVKVSEGYTAVTAPFAGRVIARKVEPGTMATPGTPLFEIERDGAYRFEAKVEESRIAMVKRGVAVPVRIDAIETPLTGRVAEIVPASDEASHSFTAKIDLPGHATLRTGLFGRAEFTTGSRQAITVPNDAISWQGQLAFVAVADKGIARLRIVKTGATRDGRVEILAGLTDGEIMIHPRPPALADSARIEVKP